MSKKLTQVQVEQFLEEKGLELLTTEPYRNTSQKLRYKCKECDEEDVCTMKNHKTRKIWCKVCQNGSHTALTHKIVTARFKRKGFTLLSKSYENDHTPLKYICKCGKEDFMPYQRFRTGSLCYPCA